MGIIGPAASTVVVPMGAEKSSESSDKHKARNGAFDIGKQVANKSSAKGRSLSCPDWHVFDKQGGRGGS